MTPTKYVVVILETHMTVRCCQNKTVYKRK